MSNTYASSFVILSSGVHEMPLTEQPKRERRKVKLPSDVPASYRLVDIDEVAAIIKKGVRTINRMVSNGTFSAPHEGRWKLSAVGKWVDELPG